MGRRRCRIQASNKHAPSGWPASAVCLRALLPPADAPAGRASACRAPGTTPRSGQPSAAIDFAKHGLFTELP